MKFGNRSLTVALLVSLTSVAFAQSSQQTDPLEVNRNIAIRETQAPAVALPGVMRIDGQDPTALDFTRARVMPFFNGQSRSIWLSADFPNRIQLPFANPRIVGTTDLVVDKRGDSNNVYVSFKNKGNARPIHVFIESPDHVAASLELVPKNIPAQTFLFEDATGISGAGKNQARSDSYESQIQSLMETVAKGQSPNGFATIDLQVDRAMSPIIMNGVVVQPLLEYTSRDRDLFVYDVVNPGAERVSLKESEFNDQSVMALSIFPTPLLGPHEHTKVFVLARKGAEK